ncbi:hypothetical protein MRB53_005004 [Persea americana]|uniref:Uncharacterized protein n=1 Tax=Persea americana TaxID=3435 RepID=A0ACC2MBS7_PERAE|nr:hypothetical protein MRB53_005004 [Persea americana]
MEKKGNKNRISLVSDPFCISLISNLFCISLISLHLTPSWALHESLYVSLPLGPWPISPRPAPISQHPSPSSLCISLPLGPWPISPRPAPISQCPSLSRPAISLLFTILAVQRPRSDTSHYLQPLVPAQSRLGLIKQILIQAPITHEVINQHQIAAPTTPALQLD